MYTHPSTAHVTFVRPVYERYEHQGDMWHTTLLPDGCTWASESTSTAPSNAAKLSHLGGWNVLHSFREASRTHRLTTTLDECAGKFLEHPLDDWHWSNTSRLKHLHILTGALECCEHFTVDMLLSITRLRALFYSEHHAKLRHIGTTIGRYKCAARGNKRSSCTGDVVNTCSARFNEQVACSFPC